MHSSTKLPGQLVPYAVTISLFLSIWSSEMPLFLHPVPMFLFYEIHDLFVRFQGKPNWLEGMTTEQCRVHHYAMLFPLVPTSLLHSSDYYSLEKCADHWGVRQYCQPREADIPDRAHYACDVNEIGTLDVSAVCHQCANREDECKGS